LQSGNVILAAVWTTAGQTFFQPDFFGPHTLIPRFDWYYNESDRAGCLQ